MTIPPGEWSPMLVGDQWPDDQDITALQHGKANRGKLKTGFAHFAEALRDAQTGPLAPQQGHTADDLRDAYRQGEDHARRVAEKSGVKESAYSTAYDSVLSLRHDLTNLAEDGNKQIKQIQDSQQPTETKVAQVVTVIQQCRALANLAAAKYGGNVLEAMQRILDEEATGQSARQFAQAHGVDIGGMFRQRDAPQDLDGQVRDGLNRHSSPMDFASSAKLPPGQSPTTPGPTVLFPPNAHVPTEAATPHVAPAAVRSPMNFVHNAKLPTPQAPPAAAVPGTNVSPRVQGSLPASAPPPISPRVTSPAIPAAPLTPHPCPPVTPPISAAPSHAITPAELLQSFDKGLQSGAPFSTAAEAMPPAPMSHAEAHIPPVLTTPSAAMGASVHTPVVEAPQPITHAPVSESPAPAPVMAGPAVPAATVPATPTGSLPAYASDLRPAISATTTPAAPPTPPPSVTPGSAPVHASAGPASPGQPTVVRHANPPTPSPSPSPSGLGAKAVAATASGAAAGALTADAVAQSRLQRLVNSVARQQPRLAWAAGDRSDNTTVLTTDLASGWIPPGIDLPAAVTLLSPARRRGDLETLLGEVKISAGYTPIHHLADPENEPVLTSPRPRRTPDIDELGYELSQATQWRDGLPRLAHTLAKAASTGTGVLDSEIELLQGHLTTVSTRVLDSYPDRVDPDAVGNWQLLAAIDALVAGDKTAANYHLAWFQAS